MLPTSDIYTPGIGILPGKSRISLETHSASFIAEGLLLYRHNFIFQSFHQVSITAWCFWESFPVMSYNSVRSYNHPFPSQEL